MLTIIGHNVFCSGRTLDPRTQRLAALEPVNKIQWTKCRRADTEMVVGRQQLDHTDRKIQVEGSKAGQECVRGKCGLFESLTPYLWRILILANSRSTTKGSFRVLPRTDGGHLRHCFYQYFNHAFVV